jgi:hypothetical protein
MTDATNADREALWKIVCDMEEDVTAIGELADAVGAFGEIIGDRQGLSIMRLARIIEAHRSAIEEGRGQLFHALHPNQDAVKHPGSPSRRKEILNERVAPRPDGGGGWMMDCS